MSRTPEERAELQAELIKGGMDPAEAQHFAEATKDEMIIRVFRMAPARVEAYLPVLRKYGLIVHVEIHLALSTKRVENLQQVLVAATNGSYREEVTPKDRLN